MKLREFTEYQVMTELGYIDNRIVDLIMGNIHNLYIDHLGISIFE